MGALHEDMCDRESFWNYNEFHDHWEGYRGTCGKTYANGAKKTIMARHMAPGRRTWLFSNTRIQDPSGDHPGDENHHGQTHGPRTKDMVVFQHSYSRPFW